MRAADTDGLLNQRVRLHVHRGRRCVRDEYSVIQREGQQEINKECFMWCTFVHDDDGRLLEESAGQAQQLPLSHRQVLSV
jgi:hypothetical protein